MQGLQAALGVAARSTGRGTLLQGFVRTGAGAAKVTVTLHNTGDEAVPRCGPAPTPRLPPPILLLSLTLGHALAARASAAFGSHAQMSCVRVRVRLRPLSPRAAGTAWSLTTPS